MIGFFRSHPSFIVRLAVNGKKGKASGIHRIGMLYRICIYILPVNSVSNAVHKRSTSAGLL